jgi:fructose-1,6-bisphosphatase I
MVMVVSIINPSALSGWALFWLFSGVGAYILPPLSRGSIFFQLSASHREYRISPLGQAVKDNELVSLDSFLERTLSSDIENGDDVRHVLNGLANASEKIAIAIAAAPIVGLLGVSDNGTPNASGDRVKKLDVQSNELIKEYLAATHRVEVLISEEEEEPVILPISGITNGKRGLVVAYDPLDGSSNIDCAVPTGTIFGIYRLPSSAPAAAVLSQTPNEVTPSLLRPGKDLIASGYVMYSSSTEMVITTGNGAHGFTLNPATRQFVLTRRDMKCPSRGPYYSLNEGRSADWPAGLRRYIDDIKNGRSAWGKKYSSRYVCSLVADFHRTLLYGGWAGNPRSHLRLLYEAVSAQPSAEVVHILVMVLLVMCSMYYCCYCMTVVAPVQSYRLTAFID